MNQIILLGRVGAEPEYRPSTHSDREIVRFPLATHRNVKVGEGWGRATDWHRVVAFETGQGPLTQYLHKGDTVAVVGDLRYHQWTDDEGKRRSRSEVVAREVSFVGRRNSQRQESEES